MPSIQLSNHEKVNNKKQQSVEVLPRIGLLSKYLDNVKSMNTLTAVQYNSELNSFVKFVYDAYGCDVDTLIDMIIKNDTHQKKTNFDPYDVLSRYTASLVGTIAPVTIKHRVLTTKNFLEYCDIEISPRKFRLKVRLPKSVRKEKEPLNKEGIVTILCLFKHAIENLRYATRRNRNESY